MLHFQKYRPQILKQYIAAFYIYHFDGNVDIQLFPKGVFELIFQSNTNFQHNTSYSSGWQSRPCNFIGGLHNKSYSVRAVENNSFCIAVEFKANTARYFISDHLNEFQNSLVDIHDVWGEKATELSQKLSIEQTNLDKVSLIEHFLLSKFIEQKHSRIDNALSFIFASKGFVEASALAENIGLSNAQFRKRFKEEVGCSPSQYCKIIRIKTALEFFEKKYQKPLVELSYQLGYFDQSHFIKDFKSVTGFTPGCFKHVA